MKNGGPAFPVQGWSMQDAGAIRYQTPLHGMSLRDYFAAAALTGIRANSSQGEYCGLPTIKGCAELAYLLADALLAEREKSVPIDPQGETK